MHSFSQKGALRTVGFVMLGVAALTLVFSQFASVTVTRKFVPVDPLWLAINDDAPLSDIKSLLNKDSSMASRRFPAGEFPIVHAVMAKRADIVKLLLEHGADPNVPGQLGSPLGIAALGNDVDTGRILLEYGADPDAPALIGMSVAQICEDEDHREFRALLDSNSPKRVEP